MDGAPALAARPARAAPAAARISIAEAFAGQRIGPPEYARLMRRLGRPRILISLLPGRCGSTYFGKLIEQTKYCGTGMEALNERSREEWQRAGKTLLDCLFRTMRQHLAGGTVWIQIAPHRFDQLASLLDASVTRDWRYSVILRRDLVAQAISVLYAVNTSVWNMAGKEPSVKLTLDEDAIVDDVLRWITRIETAETRIAGILRENAMTDVLTQHYEDIVACPQQEIIRFFQFYQTEYDLEVVLENDYEVLRKIEKIGDYAIYDRIMRQYPHLAGIVKWRRAMLGTVW